MPNNEKKLHGDHPRSRGEKLMLLVYSSSILGSPPLARGKAMQRLLPTDGFGITPARAGKSSNLFIFCASFWDHPRSRGEKRLYMRRL